MGLMSRSGLNFCTYTCSAGAAPPAGTYNTITTTTDCNGMQTVTYENIPANGPGISRNNNNNCNSGGGATTNNNNNGVAMAGMTTTNTNNNGVSSGGVTNNNMNSGGTITNNNGVAAGTLAAFAPAPSQMAAGSAMAPGAAAAAALAPTAAAAAATPATGAPTTITNNNGPGTARFTCSQYCRLICDVTHSTCLQMCGSSRPRDVNFVDTSPAMCTTKQNGEWVCSHACQRHVPIWRWCITGIH